MQNVFIGTNIQRARKQANISQEELARRCGWAKKGEKIGQVRISNYERGTRTPSIDDLRTIAKSLQIDIGRLVFGLQDTERARFIPLWDWTEMDMAGKQQITPKARLPVSNELTRYHALFAVSLPADFGHGFTEGDSILVNPDAKPDDGDYVLISMPDGSYDIGQYHVGNGTTYVMVRDKQVSLRRRGIRGVIIGKTTMFR